MGSRGPKPKPQRLKDLDGNPGKRPRAKEAIKAIGAPMAPDWLGPYALEIWETIIGAMPPGFYAAADSMLMAAYCQACDMARRAADDLKEGITIQNAQGNKVKHPAAGIMSDAMAKIATLGTRLGLDPSARQEIGIPAPPPAKGKSGSKFEGLIPIRGGKG